MGFLTQNSNLVNMEGLVYKVTNKINGKIYIGQTIQPLNKRWSEHCHNSSCCKVLRNAIQKYGKENFEITVLDAIHVQDKYDLKNILNFIEESLIASCNSLVPNGYNVLSGGNSSLGRRWKTPPMLGKKQSKEAKRKVALANIGIKRPWFSDILRKWQESNKTPIKCNETGQIWPSVKECAKSFNVKPKQISRVLRGDRKRLKWKYTFSYVPKQS